MSLSSKGHAQTVANQGREKMRRQGRSSLGAMSWFLLKGYHQFSSGQLCPALCNPMDCSMPGLPVPHHLPEFAQVHVHCISDTLLFSDSLFSSALNLSQHQGLFQWVVSLHQMTRILALQHQSFQWSRLFIYYCVIFIVVDKKPVYDSGEYGRRRGWSSVNFIL